MCNSRCTFSGLRTCVETALCVGESPPYIPCDQTETFYEDDTGDSTDDLLYSVVVEQGTSVIADSGTIDFGPNPCGGSPAVVVFTGDANFGTLGVTGKNNGNCDADFNYPTPQIQQR